MAADIDSPARAARLLSREEEERRWRGVACRGIVKRRKRGKGRREGGVEFACDTLPSPSWLPSLPLLGDMFCFWEKGPFVAALLYRAGVLLYLARLNVSLITFRSLNDSPHQESCTNARPMPHPLQLLCSLSKKKKKQEWSMTASPRGSSHLGSRRRSIPYALQGP